MRLLQTIVRLPFSRIRLEPRSGMYCIEGLSCHSRALAEAYFCQIRMYPRIWLAFRALLEYYAAYWRYEERSLFPSFINGCSHLILFTTGQKHQWKTSSSAASEDSFQLIKSWLSGCMQNHRHCQDTNAKTLPSRIIEIKKPGTPQEITKLSLIEPNENDHGRYAALSYCWGCLQLTVLTTDNISQMRQEIQYDSLPLTFQDAIRVCISLGLKYLWIDALCILQDSKRDWHKESAKMGAVFGNSLLTIKASGSSDSRGGCFIARNPTNLDPAKLRCWAPEHEDATQALVYYQEVSAGREPLETRAWTLQEDLLSPRVLSYGAKEMWWECNSAMESDGGRQVIETHSVKGLPKPLWTTRPAQFPNHLPDQLSTTRANWLFILREYGARHLSFPEDRLPALSGIAKVFQANLPSDKYHAGLWESDIPWNLLWYTAYPEPRHESRQHAPSWSWASVGKLQPDNYIMFNEDGFRPTVCCDFISATVDHADTNPYGEIRSGALVLRGPLLKVWRVLPAGSVRGEQYLYLEKDGYEADLLKDKNQRDLVHKNLRGEITWAYEYHRQGTFNVDNIAQPQDVGIPKEAWLLFIIRQGQFSRGIVLERSNLSSSEEPYQFRRIGSFLDGLKWPSMQLDVDKVRIE